MIECQRKQQSLNLLSLNKIHNITISSTPHRTLNTSRGIIRYRDEDLDNLSDEEICKELAPPGVIHVKRFITKRNGQLVKLNTFLITFNFPNIFSSIRMGLYNGKSVHMSRIQYDALSVRNSDMVRANVKGSLNVYAWRGRSQGLRL